MNLLPGQRTKLLKELALRHGFMGVGVSRAEFMTEEATRLEAWLEKGYHGEMGYMANHFDKRVDPTKLVPGAKSVVSLMYNYYPRDMKVEKEHFSNGEDLHLKERMPSRNQKDGRDFAEAQDAGFQMPDSRHDLDHDSNSYYEQQNSFSHETFRISRYAYGEDYHKVVRKKLKELLADLKDEMGDFYGRVFVDSAPVMERDWAKRSGVGWIGKNTLLIHPKKGSYFFLAEIILDVEFEYDHPIRDHCGTCTRCIDACPTDAISPEGYVLDGSKCISYLTIELKSNIPETFHGQMQNWIFGCDICQEVCPWNRFSKQHTESAFNMPDQLKKINNREWEEMTEEIFENLFTNSPLKRPGYQKVKDTVKFISKKNQDIH